ncbi:MAG TPA: alpha-glucuronidase family glycosyl hydrolase [Candidatus Angelobacter sp.]|nr:alpha-glucuronidase family glycosyl hydrolase [Candidatus Angelobacter sp.]
MKRFGVLGIGALVALLLQVWAASVVHAETGHDAWLRYAPLSESERARYASFPAIVVILSDSPLLKTAQSELIRGVHGMLQRELRTTTGVPQEPAVILGKLADVRALAPDLPAPKALRADGYWLATVPIHGHDCLVVAGENDRGTLYGVFALLRKMAMAQNLSRLQETQEPSAPVRWVNDWDNLDGRIERGYGGRSIFFDNGNVRPDLTRAGEYARLLASVGINGCVVSNVNVAPRMLAPDFVPQLARIAEAFRPWGVRLGISVDLSSPKSLGTLDTFDPLDPRVGAWWKEKAGEIYRQIPDFAGFLVKADSEGRAGPATYGRTPADAANTLARALQPHGGILLYRAFVYDHHLDWRNPKNDRARAAYDIFHPLDGKFDDNVIIQIKHGPIDFQVREPASPLFGGLEKTNQAIELQITQEYMGQQRHLCFLVPMWKQTLDFDMRVEGRATPVREIVSGRALHRQLGGFAGVANVGLDTNWLGNPMAIANLYGFARLAWNPSLPSANIAGEWTRLTFGNNPVVVRTIDAMLLSSWPTYENYTGSLGIGTLTDILGSHYGPGVASSENNGWGQWHRADHDGVGMDRTMATGTGYVGQYSVEVQKEFETLAETPDSLLLFFHHVPYTYHLHSGKTVIQHIYDAHYEGVERVREFVRMWESLQGLLPDDELYAFVLKRLQYQVGHAIVWRDAVCNWFLRTSGIPDAKGRVGHYPNRVEAESMQLQGYIPVDVEPAETASGGKAVACQATEQKCTASFRFTREAGTYDINVQYFDQNNGKAKFRLFVGNRLVDEWIADDDLPNAKLGGDTSTRRFIRGVTLRTGDEIRIEGAPDGGELAALDYVEIEREVEEN